MAGRDRAAGPDARIRATGPLDLASLATLHAACFAEAWDETALAALLAMPGTQALVAEAAGAGRSSALGFVILRWVAEEAEIISIGVRPRARRGGLGRRLLAAAAATAAGAGARRLFLEVAADNGPALALYLDSGFTQVGRRPNYYRRGSNAAMAALVLARPLGPPAAPD